MWGNMKIKDEDVEEIIKLLEKKREELKKWVRVAFGELKYFLKREDWHLAVLNCEDMLEDLSALETVEEILEKVKGSEEESTITR